MGGNALEMKTQRLDRREYMSLKADVLKLLSTKWAPHIYRVVRELPEKETFGDLDVLICDWNWMKNQFSISRVCDALVELFKPKECKLNDKTLSLEYQNFQIDFIIVPVLDSADFFYGYSDVGTIVGRMVRPLGLKLQSDGLYLRYHPIQLTWNPRDVCQFLGLDWETWYKKIKTNEDIFKWIVNSKYFNKNLFRQSNAKHRRNIAKRPFYNEFLAYIGVDDVYVADPPKDVNVDVSETVKFFGESKEKEFNDYLRQIQERKALKRKYNGDLFKRPGIEGAGIPTTMELFQSNIETIYPYKKFKDWLVETPDTVVNIEIEKFIANKIDLSELDSAN